nr:MAG TPA: hypothetical protein [Caudoviricetes sp.]
MALSLIDWLKQKLPKKLNEKLRRKKNDNN